MDAASISSVLGTSLAQQKGRVELASYKLAMTESRFASKAQLVDFVSQITAKTGDASADSIDVLDSSIKEITDPDSPVKNEQNSYFMLNVDPTHEMATLISATRCYQSIVRAYNVNSEIKKSALTLGANT